MLMEARRRQLVTWPLAFKAPSSLSCQARISHIGMGIRSFADEIEEFVTGVRRAPDSDRVLATVLFTDIVRMPSTSLPDADSFVTATPTSRRF